MIRSEEERFNAVLTGGLPRLEEALDRAAARDKVLPGDVAFRLYDTYGLPQEFIEDMVEDRKLSLDREGFERAMEGQRERARAKSAFKGGAGVDKPWTVPEPMERAEADADQFSLRPDRRNHERRGAVQGCRRFQ